MSQATHDGPIIKAATNEWVLLANRLFLSGSAAVIILFASGIRDDTASLKREFIAYQLTEEARISKLEGEVRSFQGTIEVHRKRLEGNDNDIRGLWSRLYDMASGRATNPTRPPP